jgi:hypothetical protein
MPGPTFDAPAEHRFAGLDTNDSDYFSSALIPTSAANDTAKLRPHSAGSGRSGRTASPLSFARWAKRHHHHHHQSNNQTRYDGDEEAQKLRNRDCGPMDRKANSRSGPRRLARSRSSSVQKRHNQAGAVPQMTREEFEALPLAIQRKVRSHCFIFNSSRCTVLDGMGASRSLGQSLFLVSSLGELPFPPTVVAVRPTNSSSCKC